MKPLRTEGQLRALLARICDGTASPEEVAWLAAHLLQEGREQTCYLEFMAEEAALAAHGAAAANAERTSAARLVDFDRVFQQADQSAAIPVTPSSDESVQPPAEEPLAELPAASWWRRSWEAINTIESVALIVATLTMAIIVLSLALWMVPDWRSAAAADSVPSVEFVARITSTSQASFDATSDGNFQNRDLFDDDTIVLNGGMVVIEYDTGARVVLEGPATYHVQGTNGGDLRQGKLVCRVDTEESRGFSLEIPQARIIDLGTEFGVEVTVDAAADVAVVSGIVELVGGAGSQQKLKLAAGEGAVVDPRRGEISRRETANVASYAVLLRQSKVQASERSAFEGVIYVDFAHDTHGIYTVGSNVVNVRNGSGVTSSLSETTGAVTAVDVKLSGVKHNPEKGLMPKADTDAFQLFHGFVNAEGTANQTAGTTTITIRGLDPDRLYDVALLGNRIDDKERTRDETFAISDVEAATNISSVVTTSSTSVFDTRANTRNGFVARWNRIDPGADGDLVITLTAPERTVAYLNAMRLAVDVDPTGDDP